MNAKRYPQYAWIDDAVLNIYFHNIKFVSYNHDVIYLRAKFMDNEKQAIIFIPGFDASTHNYYIDHYLGIGLTTRLEGKNISMSSDDVKIAGQSGKRFILKINKKPAKTIDIYEIYWTDLVDYLSKKTPKEQVWRGFDLLIFWLSNIFSVANKSRRFFIQIQMFFFLVLLWYYGIIAMALTAIASSQDSIGKQLPPELLETLGNIGKTMGGWPVWLVASVIIGLFPVATNLVIDLLHFIKSYLQDETQKGLGGIRDRIRARLITVMDDVLAEKSYTKIKILAHSLGTIIATDTLADYQPDDSVKVEYITLGSPLESLTYKSVWLQQEINKCLQNDFIEKWSDFYSDQDYFCSQVPIKDTDKAEFTPLSLKVSWMKQIIGASHNAYFFDSKVLEKIIE